MARASSLLALLLACAPAGAALLPVRSSSGAADVPPWPATFRLNASTFVYTCSYERLTDVSPSSVIARFGLVAFDWSEGKELWDKESPMTCEETLVAQAAALKRSNPAARVLAYRNIVKALPWQATPRAALARADAASWFLGFAPGVATHSPRCDTNFAPPRCSNLFHDQVQTPQFPNNSKYDGTCSQPCDCGPVACGEFLWDHTEPAVRDFIVNEYMLGAGGLASGVLDGFSLDDAWSNHTNAGSNACDGSPIGGPSEVDSFCMTDMNLTQGDVDAVTAGWAETVAAVAGAVNGAGGFLWNQFVTVGTPPNASGQCAAFFRAACGPAGTYLGAAILHQFSEAPGRVFDPLPAFAEDLAAFLLIRGPYAYLGFNWNGCAFGIIPGGRNNQSWSFPDELDMDVGEPLGNCAETAPGSGVFERAWSRASVAFDCGAWVGTVTPNATPAEAEYPAPPASHNAHGCADDAACTLNGVCSAGACVCDRGWAGAACAQLDLEPADPRDGVIAWPTSSWGGVAVADPAEPDLWHFFYSRFVNGCGLLCWVNASECVRATGPSPAGPFTDAAVVLGVFCHNPTLRRAPDGTYVLFHIGMPDPARAPNCSSAQQQCASNVPPPLPADGRQFLTYASAPHPAGPWTPRGSAALTGRGEGWFGWVSNPSVHFFANGSALLAFRSKVMPGGNNASQPVGSEVIGLASAPRWDGPYALLVDAPIVVTHEDPHVWADKRGNLHLLSHGTQTQWFTTPDRLASWTLAESAYGFGFVWANGTAATAVRRERPQLVFDADMAPLAFTTGATLQGHGEMALTLAQRVRGAG